MTTQRLLHRAALAATGVVAGAVALTLTLVSAVHSSDAQTPTSNTSDDSNKSQSSSDDGGSSSGSSSDDGGLSSGDQSQAPVGGSNGS